MVCTYVRVCTYFLHIVNKKKSYPSIYHTIENTIYWTKNGIKNQKKEIISDYVFLLCFIAAFNTKILSL